jgi:hypothetical protein
MNSVDAVFMDCGFSGCANVNNQANGVHASASQDPSPQKSAEYVKFFAAFFNKEPLALNIYQAVETAYNLASTSASVKPTVAWVEYSTWGGDKFIVSGAQYKKDLVTDAGGTNFDAASALANVPGVVISGDNYQVPFSAFNNSKANASSYFWAALATVSVVIDETYASDPTTYTYDTFNSTFGISSSASLAFLQQGKVLRIDRDMAASSKGLAWYESRIPRPDWAVEGLARYIVNDNSKRQKYFRNIAINENVNAISSTSCSKTLPVCQANSFSEVIPLLNSTLVQILPATTTAPTVSATVAGTFTLTLSDTSVILGNTTAKAAFQSRMATQIANTAGVNAAAVTVTVSGSRRLAPDRELAAGTINIGYSIATDTSASNSVKQQINALSELDLKNKGQSVMTSIDSTVNVDAASITTAATSAVDTTTPAVESYTDTSSAFRALTSVSISFCVVVALFSF